MGANHSVFCHTCKIEKELGHSCGYGRPCHLITGESPEDYRKRLEPNGMNRQSQLVNDFHLKHRDHEVEVSETDDYTLKNGNLVWTDYYGTEYVAIENYGEYSLDIQNISQENYQK